MSYGLKYIGEFDSFMREGYVLNIYEKDFTGDPSNLLMAGIPVEHSWPSDDPLEPLKGSELIIRIINSGDNPIDDFISVEDDTYKVEFKNGSQLLFLGYLVQDDFSENLEDSSHEITLKATDNLALLKDVTLLDAAIDNGQIVSDTWSIIQLAANKFQVYFDLLSNLSVGTVIKIKDTVLEGTYTVKTWSLDTGLGTTTITFNENLNGSVIGSTDIEVDIIIPVDLTGRMYLNDIINLCMKAVGVELQYRVYNTITPIGGIGINRLFDSLMITTQTYSNGGNWDSCHSVLESILRRFKFSMFQAEGYWNLVRWPEYIIGTPVVRLFDVNFEDAGSITTPVRNFNIGLNELTFPEVGISKGLERPRKFESEIMMYKNPDNILVNGNFQTLGQLIRTTTVGTETWEDYDMYGWGPGFEWTTGGNGYVGSSNERLIRVVKDADGVEIDRYGLVKGNTGFDDNSAAQSNNIEVVPGDRIKLSFDFRTPTSRSGPDWAGFTAEIMTSLTNVPRPANLKRLNSFGKWVEIPLTTGSSQVLVEIPPGDNMQNWHTGSVTSEEITVNGLFRFKLSQEVPGNSSLKETHYKNIRVEVIRQVGGSSKAIGHEHKDSQLPIIKNNNKIDIKVDTTPSNSIAGTLFLSTFTGPVQNIAKVWLYDGDLLRLGNITTRDSLFIKRITRYKIEGIFFNLNQGTWLSQLTMFKYEDIDDRNFVSGSLSIDYKNETASASLFELIKDGEELSDLTDTYNFRYIFEQ